MHFLTRLDGRLLFRELEPEISYIDRLVVMAEIDDVSIQILTAQLDVLQEDDGKMLILHQCGELPVTMHDSITYASLHTRG